MDIPLHFIGHIESCFPDKFGTPRQPQLAPLSTAVIHLAPKWHPQHALEGLEEFSHLWVIFVFHENHVSAFHPKVHPPRLAGQSKGVFATRSPHRPNPVGLSLVKIEKILDGKIWISGHDFIDGTPILDLKPYLAEVESIPDASSGWLDKVEDQHLQIQWSDLALENLLEWTKKTERPQLKELIESLVKLDPRPQVYKGYEGQSSSPYRSEHALRLYDGDIHFKFINPKEVQIFKIIYGL